MEVFRQVGQRFGLAAYNKALSDLLTSREKQDEALPFATNNLRFLHRSDADVDTKAQAEAVASARTAGNKSALATALDALAAAQIAGRQHAPEAAKNVRSLLQLRRELGDKEGEAAALEMLANALCKLGQPRDGTRHAKEAVTLLKSLSKGKEVKALLTLANVNLARGDFDEAAKTATELAAAARGLGDKGLEAQAQVLQAQAYLANDQPTRALKAAEEGLALARAAKDGAVESLALQSVHDVQRIVGKPVSALKAAEEALAVERKLGRKAEQAAVLLLVAGAHPGGQGALEASKEAANLYRQLGDKAGEGTAFLATAQVCLAQEQKRFDEGVAAAKEAAAMAKATGDVVGEAVALSVVAQAHCHRAEAKLAEAAAREAARRFQQLGDRFTISYAMKLLERAQNCEAQKEKAKIVVDEVNFIAHVEFSEKIASGTVEEALLSLHKASNKRDGVRCVVVHLEGNPGSAGPQSYGVNVGIFLLGLRTIGLPVILACWGKIAGPSWGLVLAADYRIAANSTSFVLPMWGPPQCLGELVGQNAATALCAATGPTSALHMLEKGIIHQCQRGQDDTRKTAVAMAKRLASQHSEPQMYTLSLMRPAVEKYATAAAKGAMEHVQEGINNPQPGAPIQVPLPPVFTYEGDPVPSQARVSMDQSGVAHVEMDELATQESLNAVIQTLHTASTRKSPSLGAIALHLEGIPVPPSMHCHGLSSGAFMIGLRSCGVPVVLAAWGKISGPSWALALTADYRIAVSDTSFMLPVWSPPECMGELVGHSVATQLCMSSGKIAATTLLEMGVLQQCVKSKGEAERAAAEMGKRIAAFPNLACRQTISLLAPAGVRYGIAAGRRDGLPPDPDLAW